MRRYRGLILAKPDKNPFDGCKRCKGGNTFQFSSQKNINVRVNYVEKRQEIVLAIVVYRPINVLLTVFLFFLGFCFCFFFFSLFCNFALALVSDSTQNGRRSLVAVVLLRIVVVRLLCSIFIARMVARSEQKRTFSFVFENLQFLVRKKRNLKQKKNG